MYGKKGKKKAQPAFFLCGTDIIRLIFRRKKSKLCRKLIKRRRGPRTLLGTIIIHPLRRFVNIHFVRFFGVNFGEK